MTETNTLGFDPSGFTEVEYEALLTRLERWGPAKLAERYATILGRVVERRRQGYTTDEIRDCIMGYLYDCLGYQMSQYIKNESLLVTRAMLNHALEESGING